MDVVLSISAWYNFLVSRLLLDAVFLPFAILLAFAIVNRKEYANRKALRFLVIVCVMIVISRYAVFVRLKTGINTRYLYMLGFYAAILCVPGIPLAARFLQYFVRRVPHITEKRLVWLLILLVGGICVGKALHPPREKFHIQKIAGIIKDNNWERKPILVSDIDDAGRIAWYANAQLLPLISVINPHNYTLRDHAVKNLKDANRKTFFLVDMTDDEFKKQFRDKNAVFPKQLKLIQVYDTKHDRCYTLYQYRL